MSPFPVGRVAAALEEAGLLVERRGMLPETALGITDDSRNVSEGDVFIAVRGTSLDGHAFLADAERRGAGAAIVEDATRTVLPALVVREGRRAAAVAAATAFGHPARGLTLVAVTGTNGKTTTVGMLRHLLESPDARSASIGTLGALIGSAGTPIEGGQGLTTPGPVELQRVFRTLADAGVRRVAMEVSSHSLDQRRVEGLCFDAAVFTNVTRDHLDYHGTMDAYLAAKGQLAAHLCPGGVAVVNADEPAWAILPPVAETITFSAHDLNASVRARDVRYTPRGSEWVLAIPGEEFRVRLPLLGAFNVANALGAAAAAWALGISPDQIALRLVTLPQVPGRLEVLHERPTVLRDYAHTPDALERALQAVRPFVENRLIVVFGCGGDRDRGKRPLMGAVAEREADLVILTSDNPRTEDPHTILDDIESGMRDRMHLRIEAREEAIGQALDLARPGDVVLLAGKGHETYQIRGTERLPFDEKAIVTELMTRRRPVGQPHAEGVR